MNATCPRCGAELGDDTPCAARPKRYWWSGAGPGAISTRRAELLTACLARELSSAEAEEAVALAAMADSQPTVPAGPATAMGVGERMWDLLRLAAEVWRP